MRRASWSCGGTWVSIAAVLLLPEAGCLLEGSDPEALAPCGNGIAELGEQCDDGNVDAGDGCSALCTVEWCGNFLIDVGEQCDGGGMSSECDADCTVPRCGDGVRNPLAGEECDYAESTAPYGCDEACRLVVQTSGPLGCP